MRESKILLATLALLELGWAIGQYVDLEWEIILAWNIAIAGIMWAAHFNGAAQAFVDEYEACRE